MEAYEEVKPPNSMYPWNEVIGMTSTEGERAVVVALESIHAQQCVIADLLRRLVYQGQQRESQAEDSA